MTPIRINDMITDEEQQDFDRVVEYIKGIDSRNAAYDIDTLEEIECDEDNHGERKYMYIHSILKHTPSGRYLEVVEQRDAREDDTLSIEVAEVKPVTKTITKEEVIYVYV